MNRSIELFVRKGKVVKTATSSPSNPFGEIIVFDATGVHKTGLTVFTHPDHSFSDPADQPNTGSEVYFFMVPMEYILDEDDIPGTIDSPFLAVNVTNQQPSMVSKKGHTRRHPCNTVLSIDPDKSASWIQYGINDYGELSLFHTKSKLKPWTKIILHPPPTPYPNSAQSKYRIKSPKLKTSKSKLHEIPYYEFSKKDPSWEWKFT